MYTLGKALLTMNIVYQRVAVLNILFLNSVLQVNPMELNVEPQSIEPGITELLLINCSIAKNSETKLIYLNSITVSHKSENESETYIEIASINLFTFTKEVVLYSDTEDNGTLSNGELNNKGDSYLSLQWMYPVQRMGGVYKCEAHGMTSTGKPSSKISYKKVYVKNLDFYSVADQLRFIKIQFKNLISELREKITKQYSELKSEVAHKETEINNLKKESLIKNQEMYNLNQTLRDSNTTTVNFIYDITSRIESSRLWFFDISPIYKGRRYYLSQQDPVIRSEEAMSTCVFYGGYLAEINDMEEHAFVVTFIAQFSGFNHVLLGGTDEGHEGRWLYRYSNSTVPSWAIQLRQSISFNCQYMYLGIQWAALDSHCYLNLADYPGRFLCEIPSAI